MYRYIIAAILCFVLLQAIAAERPTVFELLDKYAENLNKRQSYIVKTESSVIGSKLYDRRIRDDRVKYNAGELRFDGDRASSRYHMWGHVSPRIKVTKDLALYQSRLWDGGDFYQYDHSIHLPKSPAPFGTAIITRGKEKSNEKYNRSIMTIRNHSCGPLMGFFEYDAERVDRILRQADNISVRDKLEKINGSNCYVIEAKTKRGKYTVWIDPEHGYNIAKAENIKQAGDVTFSYDYLLTDKARISYFLKNVRFKKIDDLWVPIEADMGNSRIIYTGKFYIASKMHVKITDIVLNPDHDALGSFLPDDIPNGAIIFAHGARYIWQDGKLVDEKGRRVELRPKKPADRENADSKRHSETKTEGS